MLEYGEYKGHLYGTSVDAVQTVLDERKICVMDLEPQVGPWNICGIFMSPNNECISSIFCAHAVGYS